MGLVQSVELARSGPGQGRLFGSQQQKFEV